MGRGRGAPNLEELFVELHDLLLEGLGARLLRERGLLHTHGKDCLSRELRESKEG